MPEDDESTSFDPVAEFYDQTSAHMFSEEVLTPAVDLLAELAGSGPALELAIGTGRVALPLAARGVPVSGIDASRKMVERLREKPGGKDIPVAIGDMSVTSIEGTFSLVYLVWNGLWNLRTQEKQVACFENAARHLVPGGRFVIELIVPDLTNVSPGHNIQPIRSDETGWSFDVYDVVTQRLTSNHYWITGQGVRARCGPGRYAWPSELDLMARIAGMKLEDRWAGWRREPFDEHSRSHISVYQKA